MDGDEEELQELVNAFAGMGVAMEDMVAFERRLLAWCDRHRSPAAARRAYTRAVGQIARDDLAKWAQQTLAQQWRGSQ
jgi:hypothetical protein